MIRWFRPRCGRQPGTTNVNHGLSTCVDYYITSNIVYYNEVFTGRLGLPKVSFMRNEGELQA